MPFQTAADVILAALTGRTITYWGSLADVHGEALEFRSLCVCRRCRLAGTRSRLRFYAPGIGHHVEHVRPTSVRLAPLVSTGAPEDTDA